MECLTSNIVMDKCNTNTKLGTTTHKIEKYCSFRPNYSRCWYTRKALFPNFVLVTKPRHRLACIESKFTICVFDILGFVFHLSMTL